MHEFQGFDFLVTEKQFVVGFQLDEAIHAFDGIQKTMPPSIRLAPKIFILRRDGLKSNGE